MNDCTSKDLTTQSKGVLLSQQSVEQRLIHPMSDSVELIFKLHHSFGI